MKLFKKDISGNHENDTKTPPFSLKKRVEKIKENREKKKNRVKLYTMFRRFDEKGNPEYVRNTSYMQKEDLPLQAVHVTGEKKAYCIIMMEPVYPGYATHPEDNVAIDEEGNEIPTYDGDYNQYDASGYWFYFQDQRIAQGFDALGTMATSKPTYDWKTICVIGVVAAFAVWFVMKMIS